MAKAVSRAALHSYVFLPSPFLFFLFSSKWKGAVGTNLGPGQPEPRTRRRRRHVGEPGFQAFSLFSLFTAWMFLHPTAFQLNVAGRMLLPTGPSQTVSKVDLAVRCQLARPLDSDISARVFGWCDRAGLPLPPPRNDRAWHSACGRNGSVAFCGKPLRIGTVPFRMAFCLIVWMCTMPGCNSSFVGHPGRRMPVVST